MGSAHLDSDTVFCSISALELLCLDWCCAELGARLGSWDGVGGGKKCWGCPPAVPKRSRKHSQKEQETLPEGAGAVGSGRCPPEQDPGDFLRPAPPEPSRNPKSFPFFCACPCPSPPPGGPGRLRAQHVASCTRLVTLL